MSRKCLLRLRFSAKKHLARLMGNPEIAVTKEYLDCQNGSVLVPLLCCHWLGAVHGKCGLRANAVVDPEGPDLRPSVNYTLTTKGLRGTFSQLTHGNPAANDFYSSHVRHICV